MASVKPWQRRGGQGGPPGGESPGGDTHAGRSDVLLLLRGISMDKSEPGESRKMARLFGRSYGRLKVWLGRGCRPAIVSLVLFFIVVMIVTFRQSQPPDDFKSHKMPTLRPGTAPHVPNAHLLPDMKRGKSSGEKERGEAGHRRDNHHQGSEPDEAGAGGGDLGGPEREVALAALKTEYDEQQKVVRSLRQALQEARGRHGRQATNRQRKAHWQHLEEGNVVRRQQLLRELSGLDADIRSAAGEAEDVLVVIQKKGEVEAGLTKVEAALGEARTALELLDQEWEDLQADPGQAEIDRMHAELKRDEDLLNRLWAEITKLGFGDGDFNGAMQ